MAVLHLRNLSRLADSLDIRHLFKDYEIPSVNIIGGAEGHAFITFSRTEDLLSAIGLSGRPILGLPVHLRIISSSEMDEISIKNSKPSAAASKEQVAEGSNQNPFYESSKPPVDPSRPSAEYVTQYFQNLRPTGDLSRRSDSPPPGQRFDDFSRSSASRDASQTWKNGRESSRFAERDLKRTRMHDSHGFGEERKRRRRDEPSEERYRRDSISPPRNSTRFEQMYSAQEDIDYRRKKSNQQQGRRGDERSGRSRDSPQRRDRRMPGNDTRQNFEKSNYRSGSRTERPRHFREETVLQGHDRFEGDHMSEDHDDWEHDGWEQRSWSGQRDPHSHESPRSVEQRSEYDTYEHFDSYLEDSGSYTMDEGQQGLRYDPSYDGQEEMSERGKSDEYRMFRDEGFTNPGFIKMSNVHGAVHPTNLREFFHGVEAGVGRFVIRRGVPDTGSAEVYIQCQSLDHALECDSYSGKRFLGRKVVINMVSPTEYHKARSQNRQDYKMHKKMKPQVPNIPGRRLPVPAAKFKINKSASKGPVHGNFMPNAVIVYPSFFYICLRNPPADSTACSVWRMFGGLSGPSRGVLMAKPKKGATCERLAFVAFPNKAKRDFEADVDPENRKKYTDKVAYEKLARIIPETFVTKSTPSGKNCPLSLKERSLLRQKLSAQPNEGKQLKTPAQKSLEQGFRNRYGRTLFPIPKGSQLRSPQKPQASGSSSLDTSTLHYLRINELPEHVTACTIWRWYGGPDGSSSGVYLVCENIDGVEKTQFAFIEFKDKDARKAAMGVQPNGLMWNERSMKRHLGRFGKEFTIYRATDTGVDEVSSEEERKYFRDNFPPAGTMPRLPKYAQASGNINTKRPLTNTRSQFTKVEREPLQLLHLLNMSSNLTACSIWNQFGGPDGPSRYVTYVCDTSNPPSSKTSEAYVAFLDTTSRREARNKFPDAKLCGENESRKALLKYGPEFIIYRTTRKGIDRLIPESEKEKLREKLEEEGSLTTSSPVTKKLTRQDPAAQQEPQQAEPNERKSHYLVLHDLEWDVTANTIYSWFDSSVDECLGVTLVCDRATGTEKASAAFVEFSRKYTCLMAKAEYTDASTMTDKSFNDKLASFGPGYTIYQTNASGDERLLTEEERENLKKKVGQGIQSVAKPESNAVEDLGPYFLRFMELESSVTACKIWDWFDGPEGTSNGVVVVWDKSEGVNKPITAFVGFQTAAERSNVKSMYAGTKDWARKSAMRIMSNSPECVIYQSTLSGEDKIIPDKELEDLRQKYPPVQPKTDVASSDPQKTSSCYLGLYEQKSSVTACGIWSWFGGAEGKSPGVYLIIDKNKPPQKAGMAFVEFKNVQDRQAAKTDYEAAQLWKELRVFKLIGEAGPDCTVYRSTTTGEDEIMSDAERESIRQKYPKTTPAAPSTKQVNLKSLSSILLRNQVRDYIRVDSMSRFMSASRMKSQYPGCHSVTLIKDGERKAVLAFVAYERNTNADAKISQRERDLELVGFDPSYLFLESTEYGKDRIVTPVERLRFTEKFHENEMIREADMETGYASEES